MNDFDTKAEAWDDDPQKVIRANTVAEAIRRAVPLSLEMRALEYGCGTGLLGFALRPYLGAITLADSSMGMLAVLERKIAAIGSDQLRPMKLDLSLDPLPSERFHLVCNLLVLHHVQDTLGLLRTFHELLEPGGFLCVADLDEEDGSFHGPQADVHPGFNRERLAGQFLEAGFSDVHFENCFEITRNGRSYPVFLARGQRRQKR